MKTTAPVAAAVIMLVPYGNSEGKVAPEPVAVVTDWKAPCEAAAPSVVKYFLLPPALCTIARSVDAITVVVVLVNSTSFCSKTV
jgi:hypothetical protein